MPTTQFELTTTQRILSFLKSGGDITVNQARTRFGVKNVSARISEIRKAGYPVYLNTRMTNNGRTIKVYTLGTATRRIVAAGQLVLSDPYFSALLAQRIDANLNSI
jgi:predicted ArsR family transcriptional regulator